MVKILPNLKAWLLPYAYRTGPVWPLGETMLRVRLDPLRKAAGITAWPENGLQHSYRYRAKFGDAARLALEKGHTTTREIFAHYRELVQEHEAEANWKITPAAGDEKVVRLARVPQLGGTAKKLSEGR